ncbi:MAG TPA: orotate phosphoribosyltransferase [Vicinamibacteria bacterium]|jgi:orotate phosphoribosyltransferase|nr:orotate phosphoribosyltransferase [Vicinamibacteria bacterium]
MKLDVSLLRERGALLEGHFRLTSGLHSASYLQCARILMDPALATDLGGQLAAALGRVAPSPARAVVAPAIGGILVAHEVARALGGRALFTERQDGTMVLRRGFTIGRGEPVMVVEDVVTTGGSTRETIEAARAQGAEVLAAGCLIDRSGGAAALGAPLVSLLTLEVPTYPAAECPLCAQGSRPEKPGSRAL